MRRRTFLMGIPGALTGCTSGRMPRLNVFNWDNYVARRTISRFEQRYQCQVRYGVYAGMEEMLAKVMTANSGWDIVFPSNSMVAVLHEMELLTPLDHSRLPLLRNLDRQFQHPTWDPQLTWCVPYVHGATGILFNRSITPPVKAWSDLWEQRLAKRITMLDDPTEVFAACLQRLHHSVNDAQAGHLQAARALAIRQKPLLRAYLNEEVRDQISAGDVLAAQMWSQVAQLAIDGAKANGVQLDFAYPEEGFPLYADNVCLLRESRHVELAYLFMNYLLEPETAAEIAIEITGATSNAAARALLPPSLRDNPNLFPDQAVQARGEWFAPLPAVAQRLRDRYWTEIKSS